MKTNLDKNITSKNEKTWIPVLPKAVGLSKRLLWVCGMLIFLFIVMFLYFLHRYTPKSMLNSTSALTLIHQDSSDSLDNNIEMIEKIASENHTPMIAKPISHVFTPDNNGETDTEDTSLQQKIFQEGGNAAISAYHNHQSDINNTSPLPLSNIPATHQHTVNQSTSTVDPYSIQNMQSKNTTFLQNSRSQDKAVLPSRLQKPVSPFEIKAGTIIPATLMTGINSDLPGQIIAKVCRDVFDTVSGNYLLIPQGTTLVGIYSSQVAYGQSRVLIAWSRLIFPNGTSFNLEGMPGADLQGLAGLHDQVDNHYFRVFGSTLMLSLFGALGQLSQPQNNSNQLTSQQIVYGAVGQQLSQTAMQLVAKNMNIQPTIKIRPGANFNVLLTRDMVFPNQYQFIK